MKLLADDIQIAPNGGFKGLGTGLLNNVKDNGVSTLSKIISMAIGIMSVVAIIWFIFVFITGAISLMSSGGDKQAAESAKKRISSGIIGLVIVLISTLLVDLVGRLLGIEFLNLTGLFATFSQ